MQKPRMSIEFCAGEICTFRILTCPQRASNCVTREVAPARHMSLHGSSSISWEMIIFVFGINCGGKPSLYVRNFWAIMRDFLGKQGQFSYQKANPGPDDCHSSRFWTAWAAFLHKIPPPSICSHESSSPSRMQLLRHPGEKLPPDPECKFDRSKQSQVKFEEEAAKNFKYVSGLKLCRSSSRVES